MTTQATSAYLNLPLRTEAEATRQRQTNEAIKTAQSPRRLFAENGGCFLASRDGEITVS